MPQIWDPVPQKWTSRWPKGGLNALFLSGGIMKKSQGKQEAWPREEVKGDNTGHRLSWGKKWQLSCFSDLWRTSNWAGEMRSPGSLLEMWLQFTAVIACRTQGGPSREMMASSVWMLMWLSVSIRGIERDPGTPGRPPGPPRKRRVFYNFPQAAVSVIRMVTLWLMKNISLVQTWPWGLSKSFVAQQTTYIRSEIYAKRHF